jgi:glutaredoxin
MTTTRDFLKAMALIATAVGGGLVGGRLMPGSRHDSPTVLTADYSDVLRRHDAPCVVLGEAWCPHCRQAQEFLRNRRFSCVFVEISASGDAGRLYSQLGKPGFPILITTDQALVGYVETRWESALRQVSSN